MYATLVERQWFALRRVELPVLRPGSWPVRLLHLSDLHIRPGQDRKIGWVSALADLRPDLVVNTGDSLSDIDAVPPALQAFGSLLDVPGAFVFGNNDFTGPVPQVTAPLFHPQSGRPPRPRTAMAGPARGAGRARLGGPDEPAGGVGRPRAADRLGRRRRPAHPARPLPADRRARRAGCGRPDRRHAFARARVLDLFAGDGYDLVLAGHTHGGQVRIPGVGAVVTNCELDRSRARGLSRWGSHTWLHVSAGLGNNPYMPVRFACRPEATLLTLVARDEPSAGDQQS